MANCFQTNALHNLSAVVSDHAYPTISSTALDYAALVAATNGLTVAANTKYFMVQPTTNPVRVTFGGTTPTASVGISLAAGSVNYISLDMMRRAKWIREGGSDAVLQIAQLGVN